MFRRFVLAVALSLAAAGSPAIGAVTPAMAACTTNGSSGFTSGSTIVANQVVVCANTSASSSSTSSKTTAAKPTASKPTVVPKPVVCPTSVSTTAQIVAAALLGCAIPGPSQPPAKLVVAAPKTVTATVAVASVASDQAAFTPNGVTITASVSQLQIGESVIFTTDVANHERSAVILGRTGYVQFVPVAFTWSSDGGWSAVGAVSTASFLSSGVKTISVLVSYQANYRFSLAEAWSGVGIVTATNQATVSVTTPAPAAAPRKLTPHLVWSNCVAHPSSYRC